MRCASPVRGRGHQAKPAVLRGDGSTAWLSQPGSTSPELVLFRLVGHATPLYSFFCNRSIGCHRQRAPLAQRGGAAGRAWHWHGGTALSLHPGRSPDYSRVPDLPWTSIGTCRQHLQAPTWRQPPQPAGGGRAPPRPVQLEQHGRFGTAGAAERPPDGRPHVPWATLGPRGPPRPAWSLVTCLCPILCARKVGRARERAARAA